MTILKFMTETNGVKAYFPFSLKIGGSSSTWTWDISHTVGRLGCHQENDNKN